MKALSCERQDVLAAINATTDGIVELPVGTATWTQNITISKNITLTGQGDRTIIIDGVPKGPFPNVPQVLRLKSPCRVSNITFQGGSILDNANKGMITVESNDVRIDHCRLIPTQTAAIIVFAENALIDHCHFDQRAKKGYAVYAHGTGYGDQAWSEGPTLGTHTAIFIEDCTFLAESAIPYEAGLYPGVDGWSGGRVVVRHNHFHNARVSNHGTETSGRWRSGRSFEIYHNTFVMHMTASYESVVKIRGGSGVVYNNRVSADRNFNAFCVYSYFRSATAYAPWGQAPNVWDGALMLDQPGAGKGDLLDSAFAPTSRDLHQALEVSYDWGNTINGAVSPCRSTSPHVVLGTHVKLEAHPQYVPYPYPHPKAV